jgi:putative hydrolase of the HAD superfamily
MLGARVTLPEFEVLWTKGLCFAENKEMTELVKRLDGQCQKCLLSNTSDIHYKYLQKEFDVGKHFEDEVLSYKVGMVKPEPEIYIEALRRFNATAEDSMFIDDLLPNVEAARALNMKGHHFVGVEPLRKELQELGFIV